MPVLASVSKNKIAAFSGTSKDPDGLASSFFYNTGGRGVPRRENLAAIRALERTHAVQIPLQAIKSQVAATPWMIRVPEGIEPTPDLEAAAAEIEEWLDGGFNTNGESFTSLVKKWLGDILTIDSGIIELVGDGSYVRELYSRDGLSFTKAPDKHGRLPAPGSSEPAYWQFSMTSIQGHLERTSALSEVVQENRYATGLIQPFQPIPFPRDAIVWTEENPRSWDTYGQGRLQVLRLVLELILNMDKVNLQGFVSNEIPPGILQLVGAQQQEIDKFRSYWNEKIRGTEHKLPIIGGTEKAQWIPFRPLSEVVAFLDSQKWYHKLCWMVFGVGANEVGETEDVNLANAHEQGAAVWRRTTKPLLDLLAQELNRKVLVYHEAYHRVGGDLEFAWDYDNPAIKALRRSREQEDLTNGLSTVNEIRKARGLEPLPWGELDDEGRRSIWRSFPRWAMQEWLGVKEDDLPEPQGGGGIFGLSLDTDDAPRSTVFGSMTSVQVKDALRNEPSWKYPNLAGIADKLSVRVAKVFLDLQDDVMREVQGVFPKTAAKGRAFDVARILDGIDISQELRDAVTEAGLEAMEEAARHHAQQAERELNASLPADAPEVVFDFQVADTFAARHMGQQAAMKMRTVDQTVKRMIQDTLFEVIATDGGNVQDATKALRHLFEDQLSEGHARLVARTEVLSASRSGSQALAESTDLIGGKKWIATQDNRTRAWHLAMDGAIVPKDGRFTVPIVDPSQRNQGYPKSVFLVGEDQPFNCRCDQQVVLADDMPDDLRQLAHGHGIRRKEPPAYEEGLTEKQYAALFAYGQPGESFDGMLRRLDAQEGNRTKLAERLGVGKATLYGWLGAE